MDLLKTIQRSFILFEHVKRSTEIVQSISIVRLSRTALLKASIASW